MQCVFSHNSLPAKALIQLAPKGPPLSTPYVLWILFDERLLEEPCRHRGPGDYLLSYGGFPRGTTAPKKKGFSAIVRG